MNPELTQIIKIFPRGGLISPGDLRQLCRAARACDVAAIELGSRQEFFLRVFPDKISVAIDQLVDAGLPFEVGFGQKANIVTSYAAMDIFPATQWLLADTYLDILEQFDYQPRLKINLTDPQQPLVPRFSGELNFLASAYPTYWHLYVQLPKVSGKLQHWPTLIESDDIARFCYILEQAYDTQTFEGLDQLVEEVALHFSSPAMLPDVPAFLIPKLAFPVYEGFHSMGAGYWLGIFRRNYSYPVSFVEELCDLSIRCKMGKVCLTPWKSFLIKSIRPEYQLHWEKLVGKYGISIHHAATELNWQLPDLDQRAFALKSRLVRELEEKECNTTGLSFAIQTQTIPVATSVVIEPENHYNGTTYSIRHTSDFSRSNMHWRLFARQVTEENLATKLAALCQDYFRSLGNIDLVPEPADTEQQSNPSSSVELYQCVHCMTVYDPVLGEEAAQVLPGTQFDQLPESYHCSLCDAPKSSFVLFQ